MANALIGTPVGFGKTTEGARYGGGGITVQRVTNTNDSGSGSLRAACAASGNKFIVFTVGGRIDLQSSIDMDEGNVTIFGSSCPSDSGGITLKRDNAFNGPLLEVAAGQIIIENIRIQSGTGGKAVSGTQDCLTLSGRSTQSYMYFKNCTFTMASDELVNGWGRTKYVTFDRCIFAKALHYSNHPENFHGKGCIVGDGDGGFYTFYRCIFADNHDRNVYTKVGKGLVEMVECVISNCQVCVMADDKYLSTSSQRSRTHVIRCFMQHGINSATKNNYLVRIKRQTPNPGAVDNPFLYVEGNKTARVEPTGNQRLCVDPDTRDYISSTPHSEANDFPTAIYGNDVLDAVLSEAGTRIPTTDPLTDRIIADVLANKGKWIDDPSELGGWSSPATGTAWTDTDGDGIPDYYELENDTTATSMDPVSIGSDGFAEIERWVASLTDSAPAAEYNPPPVVASTLTAIEIAHDMDDSYYDSKYFIADDTLLQAGDSSDSDRYDSTVCLRFNGIYVGQGETIDEAYIDLFTLGYDGTPDLLIWGEDVDDAAIIAEYDEMETAAVTNATTATVAWPLGQVPDGQKVRSPNIAPIINEIAARSGWNRNGSMRFFIGDADVGYDTERIAYFTAFYQDEAVTPTLYLGDSSDPGGGSGATFQVAIASDADDAQYRPSNWVTTGTVIFAGDFSSGSKEDYGMVFSFPTVDVPEDADITSAKLKLYGLTTTKDWDLEIFALDADDAAMPADESAWDAAAKTTAIGWTGAVGISKEWIETPDLKTIVEDVIQRGGWVEGNSLVFGIMDADAGYQSANGRLKVASYDYSASGDKAAVLEIVWSKSNPKLQRPTSQPIGQSLGFGLSQL